MGEVTSLCSPDLPAPVLSILIHCDFVFFFFSSFLCGSAFSVQQFRAESVTCLSVLQTGCFDIMKFSTESPLVKKKSQFSFSACLFNLLLRGTNATNGGNVLLTSVCMVYMVIYLWRP